MRDEAFRSSRQSIHGLLCIFASVALLALSISPPARADLPAFLESAKLTPIGGAPEGGFGRAVAIDGDRAVVTANQGSFIMDTTPEEIGAAAYVFERDAAGVWHQTAKLVPNAPIGQSGLYGYSVALEGNVIVVGAPYWSAAHVYEYSGSSWVNSTSLNGPGFGISVAIENGIIGVSSNTPHGMRLFQRQNGAWTQIATFANGGNAGGSNYMGPNVDVTTNHAIHWSPGDNLTDPELPEAVYIYSRPASGDWSTATVSTLTGNINRNLKISGNAAVIGGAVYERSAGGEWVPVPGDLAVEGDADIDGALVARGELVRERASVGNWPAVARLVASDGQQLGRSRLSGRRIVSNRLQQDEPAAYVFDVPEDPQETFLQPVDFESGQASGWNALSGNFSVVTSGATRVYRQSDYAGNATSMFTGSYGRNQSVHGYIVPRAFNGADRWFGLAVRYTDANNHYYITVRSSQQIQLKKIVGGVVQTLASASMSVAVNRGYNLRLEANAARLRVFADDRLLFDVTDNSLLQGYSGVMMYKARADIDNITFGGNPGAVHFSTGFETGDPNVAGANGWQVVTVNGSQVISNATTSNTSHAVAAGSLHYNGTAASVRARATQFDGADRWFGLALRYKDAQNYHYITVRGSNTILLRKLVNGVPQTLDSASLPVTLNTWYQLRLEIIDQKLVAYVNNNPVLEATDPSLPSAGNLGGAALLTYKALGQFDDFHVFGY
ncbi:hypothetical protein GCM10011487_48400 [Steroidobacter agaridevorans]|uniref:3-keto-disaccharide hydrolase domain-containing protein n=1 Tax=Steroidobacter agaridevorans TaxID=2695856 RepID=A0A829YHX1_9GAMM|nr:hypothetical protein [Steroidobacter agaridevorans]GFE82840.1 hypothetical protein GCM10011487_48400 [Steroidobacter agaridevorans]GFE85925.1 hypothetical protein GCM10011488_08790 [Steroidobacter agaridevorans]